MATAPFANNVVEQAIATGKDYYELRKEGFYGYLEIRTKEGIQLKADRLVIGVHCPYLKKTVRTKQALDCSCFPSM